MGNVVPSSFCLDDIGRMLQQLTTTVTGLSSRVEHLEKGGPDKRSGRPTTATITPAGPPPSTTYSLSHNNDFADVCKCLYRWVQLRHHEENWRTLPKSLNERIQKLVADINPPMVDDEFRKRLTAATDDYTKKMVQLVQEHITKQRIDKEIHAGALSRQDIDRATEVASKYLNARLGKRLDANKRTALLQEAAGFVGRMRHPPPGLSTVSPQAPAVASPVAVQASSPPLPLMDVEWNTVSQKRKARGSPASTASAPSTSNRFIVLSADDDAEEEEEYDDVEPQTRLPTATRPQTLHSVKKIKPTPVIRITSPAHSQSPTAPTPTDATATSTTGSRVRQYRGDKNGWSIQPADHTHSIIVGDSNLVQADKVPEGWEVHCMPGAHFRHVNEAVKSIPQEPTGKYVVFVQAGVNHRDRYDMTVKKEIHELVKTLTLNQGVRRVLHVGVSIPNSLSPEQKDNIDKINEEFRHCLQEEHCIQPIPPNEVNIVMNDRYGIHHTPATIERILGPIFALDF